MAANVHTDTHMALRTCTPYRCTCTTNVHMYNVVHRVQLPYSTSNHPPASLHGRTVQRKYKTLPA